MPGTVIWPTGSLCDVQYWVLGYSLRTCYAMTGTNEPCSTPLSAYALAMHFLHFDTVIGLCACYAMPGTESACNMGTSVVAKTITDAPYLSEDKLHQTRYALATRSPVLTATRYVMPGTEKGHPAICYAMSGTELAYGATRLKAVLYAAEDGDLQVRNQIQ
eukprot:767424-Rhodomonas_salina.2